MTRPEPKNVLITGASSGLGEGLARWFAKRGARVWACARRLEKLERLSAEAKADGALIDPVKMDVRKHASVVEEIQKIEVACGGLDLVIANAGIYDQTPAKHLDWAVVEQILSVNVLGAAATLTAAIPAMVKRGRGQVVGISSLAGWNGLPGVAAYGGSKAFLDSFLSSLRVDLADTEVRVTSVFPGFVATEMTAGKEKRLPFLVPLDKAINRIGDGILGGQSTIAFPWQLALPLSVIRRLPTALSDGAVKKMASSKRRK